jgi:8-oxo-dGTP diphosphatase
MRAPNRVTGLALRDSKVLLIHRFRNENEFWVIPGGAVEDDEDPDRAIRRFLQVGTGLRLVSCMRLFEEYDEHAFTWYYYACELEPGEPELGGPDAEAHTPGNQYLLEWVDVRQITELNLYPLPPRLVEFVRTNTGSMGGMAYSENRPEPIAVNDLDLMTQNHLDAINEKRVETITAAA